MDILWSPFIEFEFMRRALMGGLWLSLSAPLVGTFLMLRRMSLTGDAMSHAILPGAAIGYLCAGLSVFAMTLGGLLAGTIVILFSGVVSRLTKNSEDSSLAAFYLMSVALGVLLMSVNGSQLDLMQVLLGSILGIQDETLILIIGVSVITLLSLAFLDRPLVMECVDPEFFSSVSRLGSVAHIGFLLLVMFNLIAGFHALGTLMSVGLMILPAAASRYWSYRLGVILMIAVLMGMVSIWAGLLFSFVFGAPSSSTIIFILGVFYLFSIVLGKNGGIFWRYWSGRHFAE